ncbi:hypothetical protein G6F62_015229 [Rhizopus arrhizus]|nr:hypothetical protein G6F62_015229 [Rhizopus arrhizus]
MELRKENDGLKEMLRKEQEEKRALQVAYSKLKEAYDELEAESGKGAKPIAAKAKDRSRRSLASLKLRSA